MGSHKFLQMWVTTTARCSTDTEKTISFFIHIRMIDRYMLWKEFHYPPPGHPRQAFQAMPLLHEAMVSEPESANLRWGLSGRHGPRYGHW
jgi:hypothetical protein